MGAGPASDDRQILTHREWRQIIWLINPQADEPDRWQGTADSQEYLILIIFLSHRKSD